MCYLLAFPQKTQLSTLHHSAVQSQASLAHPGSTRFPAAKLGPMQHSTEGMGWAGLASCHVVPGLAAETVLCQAELHAGQGQWGCSASLASSFRFTISCLFFYSWFPTRWSLMGEKGGTKLSQK